MNERWYSSAKKREINAFLTLRLTLVIQYDANTVACYCDDNLQAGAENFFKQWMPVTVQQCIDDECKTLIICYGGVQLSCA